MKKTIQIKTTRKTITGIYNYLSHFQNVKKPSVIKEYIDLTTELENSFKSRRYEIDFFDPKFDYQEKHIIFKISFKRITKGDVSTGSLETVICSFNINDDIQTLNYLTDNEVQIFEKFIRKYKIEKLKEL